jgi:hypothetical protein
LGGDFVSEIEVPTRWGVLPAKYQDLTHRTGSSHLAILFPGRNYTIDAPVMWYSARAAFDAGCDVLGVEYGYQANRTELDSNDLDYLVDEVAGALNNLMRDQYSNVVFIGKSIGTIVQTEVLQKVAFPVRNHVFLTPLKDIIPVIRASKNALVLVGDHDKAFGRSDIAQITDLSNVKLRVFPGANHELENNDYRDSIDILKQIASSCEDFCRSLV